MVLAETVATDPHTLPCHCNARADQALVESCSQNKIHIITIVAKIYHIRGWKARLYETVMLRLVTLASSAFSRICVGGFARCRDLDALKRRSRLGEAAPPAETGVQDFCLVEDAVPVDPMGEVHLRQGFL